MRKVDFYIDPEIALRIRRLEGTVTSKAGGVIRLGVTPDAAQANYLFYRGGTLRFGKLLMLDADMFITDLDPADPFKLELDNYKPQLIAGYSKALTSGGLEVFMRDRDKLQKAPVH